MFNVVAPENLQIAIDILSGENTKVIAGGTDLMVRVRQGMFKPDVLVDITRIRSLRGIKKTDDHIEIGATTTHSDILKNPDTPPLLKEAVSKIGSPQIRNLGTIGGNIVNASPAGDTLVPLYLYEATVEITGKGTKELPIEEFIKGPGKTVLKQGEILSNIRIPILKGYKHIFHKVGERDAMAISVASMGILYKTDGDILQDIRVAFGSVYPTVIRIKEVEELLRNQRISKDILIEASKIIEKNVKPISDVRATAMYRKKVAGRLIFRLLEISR
ncbi:MAG: xanthine dehydrogenase family protein subunit M [Synergistetes bacterium]|nr:xanthine dehydrogenase family protein subunit M [Synergistota bacterium]